MPRVEFEAIPDDARLGVFASDVPLHDNRASMLLDAVDAFLTEWNAHGHPLRCARAWRDNRFLAIGVDQGTAGASGCSIDGLFRTLQRMQPELGANLLPAGRVYWRGADGAIQTAARAEFGKLAASGAVDAATRVFDTSVTTAGDWRDKFECAAADSWHRTLVATAATAAQPRSGISAR